VIFVVLVVVPVTAALFPTLVVRRDPNKTNSNPFFLISDFIIKRLLKRPIELAV
jgi:hypothetical protein